MNNQTDSINLKQYEYENELSKTQLLGRSSPDGNVFTCSL